MAVMLSSGVMIGVILDTYRVLKARFRLRGWTVSLVDFLYWTVSAALVFSLLMWSNWGELRFYIFVAVCMGLFLYLSWLSRPVSRCIRCLVQWIEQVLRWLVLALHTLIWVPLVYLWLLLKKVLHVLWRLLLVLGKVALKVLTPLEWMTRPLRNFFSPYFAKIQRIYGKMKTWWTKKKRKG
ncbi:spore cortex biosynthesis protein YabQ [Lihuaxuella thermophila]|uniref:Spore cortex biosynthesis protein YabQ n=2 Tax=Lihuaxuella thermophila TaxID=1173111 RepID=A0A1H8I5I1_9BACL|nr:spore cortex biosynthesis protein YabQ [Lihuaxuella thermophila]